MDRSLSVDMARFGNLATRAQLRALGYFDRDIRGAIAGHQLWPLRRNWVVHRGAEEKATRAVALRGRLAASSALASHGVWATDASGLWIGTRQGATGVPPTRSGEHRLWVREHFPSDDDRRWRMSVGDALVQVIGRESAGDAVASIDSALHQHLLTHRQLDDVFTRLPRRLQRLRTRVNAKSQSGLESIFRIAAEDAGWRVDIQVKISRVGHVDILVDGWLVIELDGGEWHDAETARDEDARRDAELILLGYRYHRFRHGQVLNQMPLCLAVVRTILADGRPRVHSGAAAAR